MVPNLLALLKGFIDRDISNSLLKAQSLGSFSLRTDSFACATSRPPHVPQSIELQYHYLPLAAVAYSRYRNIESPLIFGVTGGPGVGKTTTTRTIASLLTTYFGIASVSISLEDFYFDRKTLFQRGKRWRGLPGTHDLERLLAVLDSVRNCEIGFPIPRFDMMTGSPVGTFELQRPVEVLLIDGWLLRYRREGYDRLAARVDHLLFLDAEIAKLKAWRFQRERAYNRVGMGMSESEMDGYWQEALLPGIKQYLPAQRDEADLSLRLGDRREVLSVTKGRMNEPERYG